MFFDLDTLLGLVKDCGIILTTCKWKIDFLKVNQNIENDLAQSFPSTASL